ncbi:hypothetical protein OH77DRAFT_1229782 [Trametes cingulata]|nr:hypothetical protein OH77DRAFT_1229782 [Trametes cingulata]
MQSPRECIHAGHIHTGHSHSRTQLGLLCASARASFFPADRLMSDEACKQRVRRCKIWRKRRGREALAPRHAAFRGDSASGKKRSADAESRKGIDSCEDARDSMLKGSNPGLLCKCRRCVCTMSNLKTRASDRKPVQGSAAPNPISLHIVAMRRCICDCQRAVRGYTIGDPLLRS